MSTVRLDAVRERYMQDDLSIRLGGLATNLMRIASVAGHPGNHQVVDSLLEESKFFIEWTAPDATPDGQASLADLQSELARCRHEWRHDLINQEKRDQLAQQARAWAEQVLGMSGLLAERGKV